MIGDARKIETTIGALIQMVLNCSIGVMAIRTGFALICLRAATAGARMKFQILSAKHRQTTKQTTNPRIARISRERNSSRCSRNDIRAMPSSSGSSSSSFFLGGLGGLLGGAGGFGGGPGVMIGFGL